MIVWVTRKLDSNERNLILNRRLLYEYRQVYYFEEAAIMSAKTKRDIQAQSTVEAIRMASASVLGTTTGLGYPIGSAMGAGSMLEQHSETVSMNIAPLIFSARDSISNSEGLELLSIEWNLERIPGPDVMPEQLIIAGGSEGGVGSHVCVLSWEEGVVDPFKIDQYVRSVSKKLGDIEAAVINNELNYETEGLNIIQRFADRLNSVLFVDMLDRKFQGSWDSLQVKPEQIAVEAIAKMSTLDDFALVPPGFIVTKRNALEFKLPELHDDILEHFQHRILTPTAIETLVKGVPEIGQAILSELNTYAYSIEEADIAETAISVLKEFLERDTVTLSEIDSIKLKAADFADHLQAVMNVLEHVVENHTSSGKNLNIEGHREALLTALDSERATLEGIRNALSHALVNQFVKSVEREFIGVQEIRAWQIKSTLEYTVTYGKRVAEYFADEFDHYVKTSAARSAFLSALRDFRSEFVQEDMDSTDLMLFEKFYTEVEAQLTAAFSKKAYRREHYDDFIQLMDSITREMIDSFKGIDVWSLIDFSDVAEIARSEIQKKYAQSIANGGLADEGVALMDLLSKFEDTVSEIIPNVADTILSKSLIRKMIERMNSNGTNLSDELASAIETAGEKSDSWKKEAAAWVEGFRESVDLSQPLPERMLTLLQYVHELLGEVISPSAMADRVKAEADAREALFESEYSNWQEICKAIESENETIRKSNKRRDDLLMDATRQYEAEMTLYEQQIREYREKLEERRVSDAVTLESEESPHPPPIEPIRPSPLERRLEGIKQEYPLQHEKQFPPEPEPDPSLHDYVELRDLIHGKLAEMKERQTGMEDTFARRILRLQAEGIGATSEISINIGDDFLEYLMSSKVRRLGRLLPRISRILLRDPKAPDLLHIVLYEFSEGVLTATIGSAFLR